METRRAPRWSTLLFRGAASILFGIVALTWPGITLVALTFLFGAYALADGVLALVIAALRGARPHRWLLVVDGLIGVGAGLATLLWPGLTFLALIVLVGARFVVSGAFQLAAAITMHRELSSPWLYGLTAVASFAFGVLTLIIPGLSALILIRMLAVFSLVFGVTTFAIALRARSAMHRIAAHAPV